MSACREGGTGVVSCCCVATLTAGAQCFASWHVSYTQRIGGEYVQSHSSHLRTSRKVHMYQVRLTVHLLNELLFPPLYIAVVYGARLVLSALLYVCMYRRTSRNYGTVVREVTTTINSVGIYSYRRCFGDWAVGRYPSQPWYPA